MSPVNTKKITIFAVKPVKISNIRLEVFSNESERKNIMPDQGNESIMSSNTQNNFKSDFFILPAPSSDKHEEFFVWDFSVLLQDDKPLMEEQHSLSV